MMRLLVLTILLGSACARGPGPLEFQPNLVLIVADDLGYEDLGFTGSPIVETPHLDRLASQGTVFTQGQTPSSICRPSLRALLTGFHPYQWRARLRLLREAGAPRLDPAEEMRDFEALPRLLATAGYTSFQAGKFWEVSHQIAGFSDGMQRPGDSPKRGGPGAVLGRDSIAPAVAFLEKRAQHPDTPFFLWFVPKLPHRPHDASEAYRARYEGRGLSHSAEAYYANVTRFDDVVGSLLATLDRLALRERTLVVFLSDNGWHQDPHKDHRGGWGGPRGKGTLHEPGHRTPVVFRLPEYVAAGARREEVVSTLDVFPTLLEYAGVIGPPNRLGRSLKPLLEGGESPPHEFVVAWAMSARIPRGERAPERAEGFSLRNADWRYVWYPKPAREALYALASDYTGQHDVAGDHPELTQLFRRQINLWRKDTRRLARAP